VNRPFPHRPRLAHSVSARRHITDEGERVILHDWDNGSVFSLSPEEWAALALADGTRDFDGIALAAAREGLYQGAASLMELLGHFHQRNLLRDGTLELEPELEEDAPESPADRPLEVFPNFTLCCDASGSCCATYESIAFTQEEAARARALRPDILEGGASADRAFLPLFRNEPRGALAVTMQHGRCGYLGADGLCTLHKAAGRPEGKPMACRVYPTRMVDDGVQIRISCAVECGCVLASAGRTDGEALVSPSARTIGDLPVKALRRLPLNVPLSPGRQVAREALAGWSRVAAAEVARATDAAAFAWTLATQLLRESPSEALALKALAEVSVPRAEEVWPWLVALRQRLNDILRADAWRSEEDPARRCMTWMGAATDSLLTSAGWARVQPPLQEPARAVETFYLQMQLFGHHAAGERPLVEALRDRAVRIWVARAMRMAQEGAADPHLLARVEHVIRGRGFSDYGPKMV
jgi:lysine-N-methylase